MHARTQQQHIAASQRELVYKTACACAPELEIVPCVHYQTNIINIHAYGPDQSTSDPAQSDPH